MAALAQSAAVDADWVVQRSRHGGVDEVPLPAGQGRLWLCGKHFVGADPEQALRAVGATTIVCLNERPELADRYPQYVEWLADNQPERAVWHPVPDLHAPDVAAARGLLEELRRRVEDGEGLLLHCGAGIGRAGTIAAGLLVTMGATVDDAIATVAAHRPMAGPEAGAQADLLTALAAPAS
jgi:protein-tyrosine phosphatase